MKQELATGHTHQCGNCRQSFHAYKDGCPCCGSMRIQNLIDMGEIKTKEVSADEFFYRYGYLPILTEDGESWELVFNHQSCPWPRGRKTEDEEDE